MSILGRLFGKKPKPTDPEQLLQTIVAFIQARTWTESQRVVEGHPELLNGEADALLAQLAQAQESAGARQAVEERRALLRRCREVGVEAAFAEKVGATAMQAAGGPGVSPELETLLRELAQPVRRGDMARRVQLCRRALALAPRAQNPAFWAALHVELGNSLAQNPRGDRADNLEEAIAAYQQALEVMTRQAMPVEWATTMMNLANAYLNRIRGDRADNLEQAIAAYQQALEIFRPEALPDDCRRAARNLGNLFFTERCWTKATGPYQLAQQAVEVLYQSSLLPGSKEAELAATGDIHHRLAYALARAGQLEDAAVALERGRARGLGESLDRDRADLEQVRQRDPATYDLYQGAAIRLRRTEAAERAGRVMVGDAAPRPTPEALRQQAEAAWRDLDTAIARIRQLPGYAGFLAQPDFDDIAAALAPTPSASLRTGPDPSPASEGGETVFPSPSGRGGGGEGLPLVYLAATPAGGLALVVNVQPCAGSEPAQGSRPAVEAIWLDGFTDTRLRELLAGPAGAPELGGYLGAYARRRADFRAWLAALEDVAGQLWPLMGPVVERLEALGAAEAVLIPSGLLALLPLHAAHPPSPLGVGVGGEGLPSPLGRGGGGEGYALDRVAFAYAPSARSLVHARQAAAVAAGARLFAVDNPDGSLRHSEREVDAVARHFGAPWIARRERATRNTALAALAECDVYHFSCHGNNNWQEPLRSALRLAYGVPLTVGDLFERAERRPARLAFLSACETGLVGTQLPDEAVGWAAGFLLAGTAGVVSTLWSVAEESTALLVDRFYENWKGCGMPPLAALTAAQQWLRDEADGGRWAHPYYWAAFTLAGV